ncbi:response regulator transcription factor [Variovorax sp. CCNWLW225]|uniref:response regulator transcription factor n=1 Tax=Variovorax sp. CCNWLW225 TaxID=3127462 RepID=UPI00307801F3
MTTLTRARILVMHGEHLVDAGLTATLSRHSYIELLEPCTAERVETLLHWLFAQRVDVVITDYDRGLSLAAALHRAKVSSGTRGPHVMVVTSRATQSEIRTALEQGVAGYLTSTSPANEVMDAVLNVQMGIRHVSGSLAISLLDNVLNEQLTPRETDVLRLAAQGLANKVIAARLQVELGTIKCHMRGILEKLGASNRTEAVVIAHERGLLAPAPVPFLARPGVKSSSASPACFRVAAPSVANGVGSEQAPLRSKPVWGTAYQ